MKRKARVKITNELLSQLIFKDPTVIIHRVHDDRDRGITEFYIESEKLDPVSEGEIIPTVSFKTETSFFNKVYEDTYIGR